MSNPIRKKLTKPLLLVSLCLAIPSGPVMGKQVSFGGYSASKASRSVATYYSDVIISKRIKSTLKRELRASVDTISVDTYSGIVSLSGTTDNAAMAKRAVELAGSIKGVKKVVPDMTVLNAKIKK